MHLVAASGEVLSVVDIAAHDSDSDAAFAVCEHALSAGRVRRDGQTHSIALYNPYSGQISWGPSSDGHVFGDGSPVAIDVLGSCGQVEHNAHEDVLHVAGRELPVVSMTYATTSRAVAAHGE